MARWYWPAIKFGNNATGTTGGGGGGLTVISYNARTGVVVSQSGDYAGSQVTNDSGVAGANVSAALDALLASVAANTSSIALKADKATTLTAAAGLTGGGDLSANRSFAVGANADGSIVVNADDVQVGVLATDAQHGNRGGGAIHAVATTGAAGFMSAADKVNLNTNTSNIATNTSNIATNTSSIATNTANIATNTADIATNTANIALKADKATTLTAGAGLTGGGNLSANRSLDVGANADGSIIVNADDVQVGVLATDAQHGNRGGGGIHAVATTGAAGFMSAADKVKSDRYSFVRVTADTSNSTTSFSDVAGSSFSVVAGATYKFRYGVLIQSANTGVGCKISVNGPAFTTLSYLTQTVGGTVTTTPTAKFCTAYDTVSNNTSTPVITTSYYAIIEGIIVPSASGTLILRLSSSSAGTAVTVKQDSYGELLLLS